MIDLTPLVRIRLDQISNQSTVRIDRAVIGDFVAFAKTALAEGHKDVAAVLAAAALEDCLKRYCARHAIIIEQKSMQDLVGALKGKGLVTGTQKSLLDTMPKLRDYAMHANWAKIDKPSVSGMIGYVEQFLADHFS